MKHQQMHCTGERGRREAKIDRLFDSSLAQAVEACEAAFGSGRDISTPGELSRLPRVRVDRVGTGTRSQSG